jgi:hypothetical protein
MRGRQRFIQFAVFCLFVSTALAQQCQFSIAGLNRQRRAMNGINVECPGSIHTAPFGNWGVTSNYGKKQNGHQFQGWCRDRFVCDNSGKCETDCRDEWYEWNSCTTHARFRAPNCYLYNSAGCREQASIMGVNVTGNINLKLPTGCPYDTNGDGICDGGGCMDVWRITTESNFLSLYELDPWGADTLIQTVYFAPTTVYTACDPWSCRATGSTWVAPTAYDSPSWPPKADARVATVVNSGRYSDPSRTCAYFAQIDAKYRCF